MENHYFKRHFTGRHMVVVSIEISCDSDKGIGEIVLEDLDTGERFTIIGDNFYDVPSWLVVLSEV